MAAEVTNAANDSTMFAPMVRATEKNLASSEANGVGTFVADTGYRSVENATLATSSEVLIPPMPTTRGVTDPDDRAFENVVASSSASTPGCSA